MSLEQTQSAKEDIKALLQLAREVEAEPRKFSKAKRLAILVQKVLSQK